MMGKIYLVLAFTLLVGLNGAFAQKNTYEIKKNNADVSISKYKKALDGATLDTYRLKDHRRILKFESGVEVELLSANELIAQGISFNGARIVKVDVPYVHQAQFKLAENGYIIESHYAGQKNPNHPAKK